MKFLRLFLLLSVLFISSCTKEYYVTEEVVMNATTVYYTIHSNDWIKVDSYPGWNGLEDSGNTYFYYDFKEPKLTNWIFNNGMMNAYLETRDEQIPVLIPLPFDNYYRDNYEWAPWTEQATCEFSPQNVRFIVKYNDFDVDRPPLTYNFMVRFAW